MKRGTIESVERSASHEELRWVRLDGYEYPFSLWDSVYDGDLEEGQAIEFKSSPVEGRNFAKITRLRLPGKKALVKANPDERFSKTEIGLMASVALKVAGHLTSAYLQRQQKLTPTKALGPTLDLADQIYEWLAQKRVKELQTQRTDEAEEGA